VALKCNNKLVQRDANGQPIRLTVAKVTFVLSCPSIEKQLQMMKDYLQSKKSGGPEHHYLKLLQFLRVVLSL
jgi:hypothetical protein